MPTTGIRVVGVDFGGKRIGIAVGESGPQIATPRTNIAASGTLKRDALAILEIAKKEQSTHIAIGVPYGAEGELSQMAKVCQKLSAELSLLGLTVHEVDEAFTSVNAHAGLREHDWTAAQRRRHVDSEAACRILERLFEGGTL